MIRSSRVAPGPLCMVLLASLVGCDSTSALDIVFVADPGRNAPRMVAETVGVIELVADSSEGVYPADTEHLGGTVEVYDVDSDGLPELVATIDMTNMSRLPVVRLEQGGMASDQPFDIFVKGAASAKNPQQLAEGEVRGVVFPSESIGRLRLPFNIMNRYLPPRVSQAGPPSPEDGVETVVLAFSKAMELSSLNQDTIRVFRLESGSEVLVPAREIEPYVFPGENQPTFVLYIFEQQLPAGNYRINVTTGARDASPEQRPLDQIPMLDGNQDYRGLFEVTATKTEAAASPATSASAADAIGRGAGL